MRATRGVGSGSIRPPDLRWALFAGARCQGSLEGNCHRGGLCIVRCVVLVALDDSEDFIGLRHRVVPDAAEGRSGQEQGCIISGFLLTAFGNRSFTRVIFMGGKAGLCLRARTSSIWTVVDGVDRRNCIDIVHVSVVEDVIGLKF